MTTESELRRENLQRREERDMLELRQENRDLKRQIERLQNGKPARGQPRLTPGLLLFVLFVGMLGFIITGLYLYKAFT